MRGRPVCVLLRRFAPLVAVAVLVAPAQAVAAPPSPDRAPSTPGGLAPDPVPGSAPARAAAVTGTPRPAYVPPVHPAPTTTPAVPKKHAAARPAHKPAVPKRGRVPSTPFVLPHVAVPALGTIAPARTLRGLDVLLAGVALLLAAATAGSGARLVSVYNRRIGAA